MPGDLVYVLGETKDELGGSEYYAMNGIIGNNVPKVDATSARNLYNKLSNAIQQGLVASCHDASDGGLGVAFAESAFAGGCGLEIELNRVPTDKLYRADTTLFSESASRFVVTINPNKREAFENLMHGTTHACVGYVRPDDRFVIHDGEKNFANSSVHELKEAWQAPLQKAA